MTWTRGTVLLGLVGAGGCGRDSLPLAREAVENLGAEVGEVCFVESTRSRTEVAGIPCLSEDEFLCHPAQAKFFSVTIADPHVRRQVAERLISRGLPPLDLAAANSTNYSPGRVGPGLLMAEYASIMTGVTVGSFFHANLYSHVSHDCVIGSYVTFSPGVRCNGNVHIGDGVFIGAGAILRNGTHDQPLVIGANAVVGMGAVVTKSVPAGATVIGNPARLVRTAGD